MPLGIERFTLTVRELVDGLFRVSKGEDAASIEMAFDDLRERVKRGDKQALRALVWLGFAVGKERDAPDVELALEAKARVFLDAFASSRECGHEYRELIHGMLQEYLPLYQQAGKSADRILISIDELERDMEADRRVRQA